MTSSIEHWLLTTLGKLATSTALTVASFFVGRFWLSVLKPWIQSFWWQGVHLDSTYAGEFTLPGATQAKSDYIELQQKANRITGTMTVAESRHGKYEFTATLDSNVLRGTWKAAGAATDAIGSFLLMVEPGSRELSGWCVEPISGKVVSYPYRWTVRK